MHALVSSIQLIPQPRAPRDYLVATALTRVPRTNHKFHRRSASNPLAFVALLRLDVPSPAPRRRPPPLPVECADQARRRYRPSISLRSFHACDTSTSSNVEVHTKLIRMRPRADRVYFVLALVLDPVVDHVGGEDVALEEELVVVLQHVQRLLERFWRGADFLEFVEAEFVDVL